MINPLCKLCSLGVQEEPGLSQRQIAKKYGVGKSSVGRHLRHIIKGENVVLAIDPIKDIVPPGSKIASETVTFYDVQTSDGIRTLQSRRVRYTPVEEEQGNKEDTESSFDLKTLFARVYDAPSVTKKTSTDDETALVVVWADAQTGKQDKLGGTAALMTRMREKQDKLREHIHSVNASSAFFLDVGDSIENFENTGQQQFTNDLSLMDQIDLEATFEQEFIRLLAENHSKVVVGSVGSNHCAWRKGKSVLGTPSDDWGIFIKKQLEKAFALNPEAYGHIEFKYPDRWEEFLEVDVLGHGVGMVHGHQKSSPEQIPKWWEQQIHGGSLSNSEILLTGHFHHLRIVQTGRHITSRAQKYHIQAPALDNGSAWYSNLAGQTSDPGLLVFTVSKNNVFDVGSITVL